ncbi:MAG: MFS transporter [Chloroflexi bacterium]|nr:MFS transporter [Chloroflexota bacterium]
MGETALRRRRSFHIEDRYLVLALCCMCFSLYHAARQILLPALPIIKDELQLTYTEAGVVVGAYNVGYATTLLLAGYISDLFKRKPLILGGLLWLAITLALTTFARNFVEITIARFMTGIAFGTYFAPGIALITAYFSKEERGTAVSLHTGLGAGSGRFLAPALAGLTLVALGWAFLFYAFAAIALVTSVLFWRKAKDPASEQKGTLLPAKELFRKVIRNRFLIVLGTCAGTITTCGVVTAAFLPLYLVNNLGMDVTFGGYAVALLNGMGIPMVPVFGYLSDRIGRRPVIIGVVFTSAVALFFLNRFTSTQQLIIAIALSGLFLGGAFPIIITYVVDVMPLIYRSASIGYVNTFTVLTSSIASVIAGAVSDNFGVAMVFPFLAAISTFGAIIIFSIRPPKTSVSEVRPATP